jgi:hypothetical protein
MTRATPDFAGFGDGVCRRRWFTPEKTIYG